jgi:hypothetical protein
MNTTTKRANTGTLRLGNVMVECIECGKLTHSSNDGYGGADMCKVCLERTLYSNQCSDGTFSDEGCDQSASASCPVHGARFARLDAQAEKQEREATAQAVARGKAQTARNEKGLALWLSKLEAWDAKPRCAACLGYRASKKTDLCPSCADSVKYYGTSRERLWEQQSNDRHHIYWQRVEIEDKIVAYGGTRPAWPFSEPRPGAGRKGMGY